MLGLQIRILTQVKRYLINSQQQIPGNICSRWNENFDRFLLKDNARYLYIQNALFLVPSSADNLQSPKDRTV